MDRLARLLCISFSQVRGFFQDFLDRGARRQPSSLSRIDQLKGVGTGLVLIASSLEAPRKICDQFLGLPGSSIPFLLSLCAVVGTWHIIQSKQSDMDV